MRTNAYSKTGSVIKMQHTYIAQGKDVGKFTDFLTLLGLLTKKAFINGNKRVVDSAV